MGYDFAYVIDSWKALDKVYATAVIYNEFIWSLIPTYDQIQKVYSQFVCVKQ